MQIWNWELEITDHQIQLMPADAKILDVQMQGDACIMWALCDPDAERELRYFGIYGTGNPVLDDPGKYIATVQVSSIECYHVFEE